MYKAGQDFRGPLRNFSVCNRKTHMKWVHEIRVCGAKDRQTDPGKDPGAGINHLLPETELASLSVWKCSDVWIHREETNKTESRPHIMHENQFQMGS